MIYVDANVILRYLLNDDKELSEKSKEIIEGEEIFIKNEVFAEIVYVVNKTYNVPKKLLKDILIEFLNFENIIMESKKIIVKALIIFAEKNLDFIDSLLCAFSIETNNKVITFDKKLIKCLKGGKI